MSHSICEGCGARYRDEHECPKDGASMLERINELEDQVADLQASLIQVRLALGMTDGLP